MEGKEELRERQSNYINHGNDVCPTQKKEKTDILYAVSEKFFIFVA